jgi:ribosomal protein S18 acetylase RimI-like enzyme
MGTPVVELAGPELRRRSVGFVELLQDAIASGASVSFMAQTPREQLAAFWEKVAGEVESGATRVLASFEGERVIGTVQLKVAMPPNQPHRGEIAKLLVHRSARGRGLGAALMTEAEALARREGKTLLVLDTVADGDADRLYRKLGWTRLGEIPGYALMPDGALAATSIFYKQLA